MKLFKFSVKMTAFAIYMIDLAVSAQTNIIPVTPVVTYPAMSNYARTLFDTNAFNTNHVVPYPFIGTTGSGSNTNFVLMTNGFSTNGTFTNGIFSGNAQFGKITNVLLGTHISSDYSASSASIAYNLFTNTGGNLSIPFGTFNDTGFSITSGGSSDDGSGYTPFYIRGITPGVSHWHFIGTNGSMVLNTSTVGLNISDLDIDNGGTGTNTGINFGSAASAPIWWSNVRIRNFQYGASLGTLSGTFLYGVYPVANGVGIRLPGLSDNIVLHSRPVANTNTGIEISSRGNQLFVSGIHNQNDIVVGSGGGHSIQISSEAFTNAAVSFGHPFNWPFHPDLNDDSVIIGSQLFGGYFIGGSATSTVAKIYLAPQGLHIHEIAANVNIVQIMTNTANSVPLQFDNVNASGSNYVVFSDGTFIPAPSQFSHVTVNYPELAYSTNRLLYERNQDGTILSQQEYGAQTNFTGTNYTANINQKYHWIAASNNFTLTASGGILNSTNGAICNIFIAAPATNILLSTPNNWRWESESGLAIAPTNVVSNTVLHIITAFAGTNMPIAHYLIAPPVPLDSDAQAFITAASITDQGQKTAINNLVVNLKGHNLWNRLDFIYPFVGGSATPHTFNLKNTAAFQITWAGGLTHNANGVIGNGTTGWGNSGFTPSTAGGNFVQDSATLAVYLKTGGISAVADLLSGDGSSGNRRAAIKNNGTLNTWQMDGLNSSTAGNNSIIASPTTGVIIASRTSSTAIDLYINAQHASASDTSVGNCNVPIGILARYDGVTPDHFAAANLAFAAGGAGFNVTDAAQFSADILQFETDLGRQ